MEFTVIVMGWLFFISTFIFSFGKDLNCLNIFKICNDGLCYPRFIWTYWNDDFLPEDVEEMANITKISLVNFTLFFLTVTNVSEFFKHNIFPDSYYGLRPANKADYIRVHLLKEYGGIWIDSTMYVTSGNAMEWVFSKMVKSKCEIIGFPEKPREKFFIIVSFFAAAENSWFMKKMKEEYDIAMENLRQYIDKVNAEIIGCASWVSSRRYFLLNTIFSKTVCSNESLRRQVFRLPDAESPDALIYKCSKNLMCVRNRLLNDPVTRSLPFIKLWHNFRNGRRIFSENKEDKIATVSITNYDRKKGRKKADKKELGRNEV